MNIYIYIYSFITVYIDSTLCDAKIVSEFDTDGVGNKRYLFTISNTMLLEDLAEFKRIATENKISKINCKW